MVINVSKLPSRLMKVNQKLKKIKKFYRPTYPIFSEPLAEKVIYFSRPYSNTAYIQRIILN